MFVVVIGVTLAHAYVEWRHAPRRLSKVERARVEAAVGKARKSFKLIAVAYAEGDGEAERYAVDFQQIFAPIYLAYGSLIGIELLPENQGICVVDKDWDHPRTESQQLFQALMTDAKLPHVGKCLGAPVTLGYVELLVEHQPSN
jgi:hypothetical protein